MSEEQNAEPQTLSEASAQALEALENGSEDAENTEEQETLNEEGEERQESKETEQEKLYKVATGEYTAEEIAEKYDALNREFSKRTNELNELKTKSLEEDSVREETRESVTQGLPSDVRQALVSVIDEHLNARDEKKGRQEFINGQFEKLSHEWDGKEGKPRFTSEDKLQIMEYMASPNATIFDPKAIWEQNHMADIRDYWMKSSKKPGIKTEKTSGGAMNTAKPKSKTPSTLREAKEAMQAYLESH